MRKSFALELHGEWSEFANECIGLVHISGDLAAAGLVDTRRLIGSIHC
jgi:predicted xylose isomerase-like sugar epimerase